TDYRHASLDLSAFANQYVLVRFRLESDELLQFDGWYIDNLKINDANCVPVVSVGFPGRRGVLTFAAARPNPTRGVARFAFELPQREERVEILCFDVAGRQVRLAKLGPLGPGVHEWTWDGRDASGR